MCKLEFKGRNNGISIKVLKYDTINNLVNAIIDKINKNINFFSGSDIVEIDGLLGNKDIDIIKNSLNKIEGVRVNLSSNNIISEKKDDSKDKKDKKIKSDDEMKTKFIQSTIRSGQLIEYDGNIVIIGDVNPGGEIKAKGNIIVFGRVKGIVHAGYKNTNNNCIVAAYKLNPTQLRICDVITIPPSEKSTNIMEVAKISGGTINVTPTMNIEY